MNIIRTIRLYFGELFNPISRSSHLKEYEEIASQFDVPAGRVRRLAHGVRPETRQEQLAINELINRDILQPRNI